MPTPRKRPPRASDAASLSSSSTVAELVATTAFDDLTGPQLVVYLRLVALDEGEPVVVPNAALYREPRTATRALKDLGALGLVSVKYDAAGNRLITLHRRRAG